MLRVKKVKKDYSQSLEEKIEYIIEYVIESKKLKELHKNFTLNFPKWNSSPKCQNILKVAIAEHSEQIKLLPVIQPEYIRELPEPDSETGYTARLVSTDYTNRAQEIINIERSNVFAYTRYNIFINVANSILNTVIKLWVHDNINLSEFYKPNTDVCNKLQDCDIELSTAERDYLLQTSQQAPESLISLWYARSSNVNQYYTLMREHLECIKNEIPYNVQMHELVKELMDGGITQVINYHICEKYIEFMNLVENFKSDTGLQIRRRDQWYKYISSKLSNYSIKLNVDYSEEMTVFLNNIINWIERTENILIKQNNLWALVQKEDAKKYSVNLNSPKQLGVTSKIIDLLTDTPGLTDYLEKKSGVQPTMLPDEIEDTKMTTYSEVQEHRAKVISKHDYTKLIQNLESYFEWYIITDQLKTMINKLSGQNDIDTILSVINNNTSHHVELCEVITFIALNKNFGKNTEYLKLLSSLDNIPSSEYSFDLSGRSVREISDIIKNLNVSIINPRTYELYNNIYNLIQYTSAGFSV